jgi:hypothetical protein
VIKKIVLSLSALGLMLFAVSCGGGGGSVLAFITQIIVLDFGNDRIVGIDDMTGANWVAYGTAGSGMHQFDALGAVAVDRFNRIYIADRANDRIIRVDDLTGAGWTTFGSNGTGVGQFDGPFDVALYR